MSPKFGEIQTEKSTQTSPTADTVAMTFVKRHVLFWWEAAGHCSLKSRARPRRLRATGGSGNEEMNGHEVRSFYSTAVYFAKFVS